MTPEPPIPKQQWDEMPPVVQTALRDVFERYEQRIARLEKRVRELEERLGRNSTNSSRPPSSDAPAVQRTPPRPATGRRRGGQPGHPFQGRALLPPDRVHALKPAARGRTRRQADGGNGLPTYRASVALEAGKYAIDFKVNDQVFSALNLTVE
jgi:transposase